MPFSALVKNISLFFFLSKKQTCLEIARYDEKCTTKMYSVRQAWHVPSEGSAHYCSAVRLPLRPVSYLEHTNEDWIRYQLSDSRNVLLNIYDNHLLYACVARVERKYVRNYAARTMLH